MGKKVYGLVKAGIILAFGLGVTNAMADACSEDMGHSGNGHQVNGNQTGSIGGTPWGFEQWSGGGSNSMTYYDNGTFKANWSNNQDYLARVGYRYGDNGSGVDHKTKHYTVDYKYTKTGSAQYGYIGVYGWTVNPQVEYYIVDDWFSRPSEQYIGEKRGEITVDGATYTIHAYLRQQEPSKTGTSTFLQIFSVRSSPRQCGHIDISAHFNKWDELFTGQNAQLKGSKGGGSTQLKFGRVTEVMLMTEAGGNATGSVDYTYFNMSDNGEASPIEIHDGNQGGDQGGNQGGFDMGGQDWGNQGGFDMGGQDWGNQGGFDMGGQDWGNMDWGNFGGGDGGQGGFDMGNFDWSQFGGGDMGGQDWGNMDFGNMDWGNMGGDQGGNGGFDMGNFDWGNMDFGNMDWGNMGGDQGGNAGFDWGNMGGDQGANANQGGNAAADQGGNANQGGNNNAGFSWGDVGGNAAADNGKKTDDGNKVSPTTPGDVFAALPSDMKFNNTSKTYRIFNTQGRYLGNVVLQTGSSLSEAIFAKFGKAGIYMVKNGSKAMTVKVAR